MAESGKAAILPDSITDSGLCRGAGIFQPTPIPIKLLLPKTLLFLIATASITGTSCRQKERVLDVDTPAGHLKVDKDKKSGDVEIRVDDKK